MSACATSRPTVSDKSTSDSIRTSNGVRDSTYRRDSIFVREYTRGDTVYIDRWHDRWQERTVERKDTVFIDRKEVVREKEHTARKGWTWFLSGGCTALLLLAVARIGLKLIIKN